MRVVAGAITCAILLTACSAFGGSSPPAVGNGPLGDGGSPGEVCVTVGAPGLAILGLDDLRNRGHEPVSIDSVRLLQPKNLLLTKALLVPISGHNLIGIAQSYPPPGGPESGVLWDQRRSARGAHIAASDGSLTENLVIWVRAPQGKGKALGLDVRYHDSRKTYEMHTGTRLRLEVQPSTC